MRQFLSLVFLSVFTLSLSAAERNLPKPHRDVATEQASYHDDTWQHDERWDEQEPDDFADGDENRDVAGESVDRDGQGQDDLPYWQYEE